MLAVFALAVCSLLVDEDDLQDVRLAVADLAGKWKDLGISLGIRSSKLDTINLLPANESLREMLTLWLKQSYNVRTIIIIAKHTSFVTIKTKRSRLEKSTILTLKTSTDLSEQLIVCSSHKHCSWVYGTGVYTKYFNCFLLFSPYILQVERFGKPTWRRLVEAVKNEMESSNPALAEAIAKDHPGM